MRLAIAVLILALGGAALAQQHQQHHQPYAGMQQRPVKALSDQQIADLKAGRGMGLALAAELNGYPGPMHTLELASQIKLSAEQITELRRLYEAMKAEAIVAGERLIASERDLDHAFASGTIAPDALALLTARIGEHQGALRAVHLRYHLSTAAMLNAEQRQRYAELRGYRSRN